MESSVDLFILVLYKLMSHPYVSLLLTISKNLRIYNPKSKAALSSFYILI